MCSQHFYQSMDQPGMVANSARDHLNGEDDLTPVPVAPDNLVLRGMFGCPVPRRPAHSPHSG